jgi:ubiquitin-like-conjugating enzyme ATG10
LTCEEFSRAINSLLQLNDQHGQNHNEWITMDIVTQNETTYLSIAKPLPRDAASLPEQHETDGEVEEDDDEEVLSRPMRLQPTRHYDIVLSPTYRVPVLHVSISDTQQRYPPTMAVLKAHVIPTQFQAETEHVGIIGGITVTVSPTPSSAR